jgi:hypothetical protein
MTSRTKNLLAISMLIAATLVNSRLVVYGPPELKSKFEFQGNYSHFLSKRIYIDYIIKANYANFGNIPYG